MARRYDSRTTIFSPEGRLFQVEYAMEAISHAGTTLGILATDGVVLAAEKRVASPLLDQHSATEKIYVVNENIALGVAGITSDANTLLEYARQQAQRFHSTYGEPIPCEQLAQSLCDLKQGYTQYGGLRPFGVSFLYAGWDAHHQFQLYHSDPSGNYFGWKAHCIGSNHGSAEGILKQDYQETMNVDEALRLAIKVLSKTMETTNLTVDKLEFATITRKPDENGGKRVVFHMLTKAELGVLLKEHNDKKTAEEEAEGKKTE